MKFSATCLIPGLVSLAAAMAMPDPALFGPRAVQNLESTPSCAKMCLLNPKYARTYASEGRDIDFGPEYGRMLCHNAKYQFMLDACIKEKCSDEDRRKARELGKDTCEGYGVDLTLPAW
jgi:hypothetical protein